MIRSSIQIVNIFVKDLISFMYTDKRLFNIQVPFGSPLTMIGILSKRSTSENNRGSNVLFSIIK